MTSVPIRRDQMAVLCELEGDPLDGGLIHFGTAMVTVNLGEIVEALRDARVHVAIGPHLGGEFTGAADLLIRMDAILDRYKGGAVRGRRQRLVLETFELVCNVCGAVWNAERHCARLDLHGRCRGAYPILRTEWPAKRFVPELDEPIP